MSVKSVFRQKVSFVKKSVFRHKLSFVKERYFS